MEYEQTKGSVKRKFTLHENHISIKSTPFGGNHTETNYEYKAVSETVSTALIRANSFSGYLWAGIFSIMFVAMFLFTEPPTETKDIIAVVLFIVAIVMFFISFIQRKRIPFQVFHNKDGAVLFDIGGDSNEFKELVSELKKRILLSNK